MLILVTTTFPHELQLMKLSNCIHALTGQRDVTWIVTEDASSRSSDVASLLAAATQASSGGLNVVHLAHGPTRQGGNAQRNVALKYIRERRLEGVVYNMDDDNGYHPHLWNELRRVQPGRVGVLAARRYVHPNPQCDGTFNKLGPYKLTRKGLDKSANGGMIWGRGQPGDTRWEQRQMLIDKPRYNATGAFAGFDAGWCAEPTWMTRNFGPRVFCVDMASFAFDATLLHGMSVDDPWNFTKTCESPEHVARRWRTATARRRGRAKPRCTTQGGENEFLLRLIGPHPEMMQPLANCGQDVLVFHNEYRQVPRRLSSPRAKCEPGVKNSRRR